VTSHFLSQCCVAQDGAASAAAPNPALPPPSRHPRQATLLSLLDPWLAEEAAAATSGGDTTNASFLGSLVRWLRSNFALEPEGAAGAGRGGGAAAAADTAADAAAAVAAAGGGGRRRGRGGGGGGGSGSGADLGARLSELLRRPEGGLGGQLLRCVEARRGTAEQLNALLVALLRGLGLLTRTTWCAGGAWRGRQGPGRRGGSARRACRWNELSPWPLPSPPPPGRLTPSPSGRRRQRRRCCGS
jgi:hypothetical protein